MALERAAWLEERYRARIIWEPYDLHPEHPPEGVVRDEIEARYPPGFGDRLRTLIESASLSYQRPDRSPNSLHALELAELARERGRFKEMHRTLFLSYWSKGIDIGSDRALVEIGVAAGLDKVEIHEVLRDGRYREAIRLSTERAHAIGVNGIPAWVIDFRVMLLGAHPHGVFDEALAGLGHRPHAAPAE
ncbi:MAG: DsbA family oxidoreductase [Actinomycetota bacterium]